MGKITEMKKKILFFVPEWNALTSAVLHSQVLSVARFLSENGFECMFVGCINEGANEHEAEKLIKNQYAIPAIIRAVYSAKYGYLGMRLTSWRLQRVTEKIIEDFRPTYIYSRSIASSQIARKLAKQCNAVAVLDMRAALSEEVKLRRKNALLRYCYIRYVEKTELKKADKLVCVSQNLKAYIENISGRKKVSVIPCCFDKKKFRFDEVARQELRKLLGFDGNQKVICYSGGLANWQRIDDIISLYEKISKQTQGFKFLFLTQKRAQLQLKLDKSTLCRARYVIKSCEHDDVYRYLSAADAGIIMREDTIVNNVASPIKIAEYLACGLPVILTRGIGDASDLISQNNLGLLLIDSQDISKQVIQYFEQLDVNTTRNNAIKFCDDFYSMEAKLDIYKTLYS